MQKLQRRGDSRVRWTHTARLEAVGCSLVNIGRHSAHLLASPLCDLSIDYIITSFLQPLKVRDIVVKDGVPFLQKYVLV